MEFVAILTWLIGISSCQLSKIIHVLNINMLFIFKKELVLKRIFHMQINFLNLVQTKEMYKRNFIMGIIYSTDVEFKRILWKLTDITRWLQNKEIPILNVI